MKAVDASTVARTKRKRQPTFCSTGLHDTYQRIAVGALSWDAIIQTGGGSALLYKRLLSLLDHENVILADNIESIHLANVRGGLKLWRLYEALQVV